MDEEECCSEGGRDRPGAVDEDTHKLNINMITDFVGVLPILKPRCRLRNSTK